MRKILIAGLLAVAFVASGGFSTASAHAAAGPKPPSACPPGERPPAYPPGRCRLVVAPTTVEAGGTVRVSGCGFAPGSMAKALTRRSTGPRPAEGRTAAIATDDIATDDTATDDTAAIATDETATIADGEGRAVDAGRLRADASGCITGSLVIRPRTSAGAYIVTATGRDANAAAYELVSEPITMTATGPAAVAIDADRAASVRPARESPASLVAALGLVLLGGFMVSGLRRRRPST